MKINEKNLCAYSVSPSHIDKEGYLLKKSEVNKSFQRRWFVLKGNLLFYFEKKSDREPLGVIILEGCTIELAECDDLFTFKLVFHGGGGRTYLLGADCQEALEVWMKALARASYDYLKLMVAELQKQLDELNETEEGRGCGEGVNSQAPVAPQRQRQNPFNRTQSSNEVALDPCLALRMRANTVSGGSRGAAGEGGKGTYLPQIQGPTRPAPRPPSTTPSSSVAFISINKRTFSQLHAEYGVLILQDMKEYRLSKRSKGWGSISIDGTSSEGKGSDNFEGRGNIKSEERESSLSVESNTERDVNNEARIKDMENIPSSTDGQPNVDHTDVVVANLVDI